MAEEFVPSPKFLERMKLFTDTVECKKTDRIPLAPMLMYLPIYLYGLTNVHDVMVNYANAEESFLRFHEEYQPDLSWGPQAVFPGPHLELLGCNYINMPGVQIPDPNAVFQVVDNEDGYMEPEEYLEFAEDPTGFVMRKILPRHYSALKPLEMIDFSTMIWQSGCYGMIPFATPPVQEMFGKMAQAGGMMMQTAQAGGAIMGKLAGMGFPNACDGCFDSPFDVFNDTLRGFMNASMDMLEYPDEMLVAIKAMSKINNRKIRASFAQNPWQKTMVCYIHNGFDSFMSREQFETFYWPGLLEAVKTVIDCGGIPRLYIEDKYDMKLDIIARDLPANKCIVTLINCDVEKAKKLFNGKVCIDGGLNGVLLQHGTPEDVVKNVKEVVDVWAEGGGFILNADVSLDLAKEENLKALYYTARDYMNY